MAASHYSYNTLKMQGPMGVFSIPSDKKDAIICVDKMYRDAIATEAVEAAIPAKKTGKGEKLEGIPTTNPGSMPLRSALHLPMT